MGSVHRANRCVIGVFCATAARSFSGDTFARDSAHSLESARAKSFTRCPRTTAPRYLRKPCPQLPPTPWCEGSSQKHPRGPSNKLAHRCLNDGSSHVCPKTGSRVPHRNPLTGCSGALGHRLLTRSRAHIPHRNLHRGCSQRLAHRFLTGTCSHVPERNLLTDSSQRTTHSFLTQAGTLVLHRNSLRGSSRTLARTFLRTSYSHISHRRFFASCSGDLLTGSWPDRVPVLM